jgi:MFS family permease
VLLHVVTMPLPVRGARATHLRSRWTVVGAATVAMLTALPVWITSAVAVLMRDEIALTEPRLGVAVSVYFAVSASLSWPAGRLADRIGARTTATGALACSVTAVLGLALLAGHWTHVVLLLGLAGAGSALVQPATNLAIVRGVPLGRQGLGLGLKQAAVPAATLAAGATVPMVALTLGWRWAYVVPLVVAVAFLSIRGAMPDGRRPGARLADADGGGRGRLPLIVVAATAGLGVAACIAASAFLIPYAVAEGVAVGTAGWILSVASLAGVAVRIGSGWLADRTRASSARGVAVLLGLGALGAAGVALADGAVTLTVAAMVMLGAGWGWNGLLVLALVRSFPATPGLATGISQVGIRAGGAVGPSVFGFAAGAGSYLAGWILVASAMLTASIGMLWCGRRLPDPGQAKSPAGSGA